MASYRTGTSLADLAPPPRLRTMGFDVLEREQAQFSLSDRYGGYGLTQPPMQYSSNPSAYASHNIATLRQAALDTATVRASGALGAPHAANSNTSTPPTAPLLNDLPVPHAAAQYTAWVTAIGSEAKSHIKPSVRDADAVGLAAAAGAPPAIGSKKRNSVAHQDTPADNLPPSRLSSVAASAPAAPASAPVASQPESNTSHAGGAVFDEYSVDGEGSDGESRNHANDEEGLFFDPAGFGGRPSQTTTIHRGVPELDVRQPTPLVTSHANTRSPSTQSEGVGPASRWEGRATPVLLPHAQQLNGYGAIVQVTAGTADGEHSRSRQSSIAATDDVAAFSRPESRASQCIPQHSAPLTPVVSAAAQPHKVAFSPETVDIVAPSTPPPTLFRPAVSDGVNHNGASHIPQHASPSQAKGLRRGSQSPALSQIDRLRNESRAVALQHELQTATQRITNLSSTLAQLVEAHTMLSERETQLRTEAAAAEAEREQAEVQCNELRVELESSLQQLQGQLTAKRERLEMLRAENQRLRQQLGVTSEGK